jgi:hypothetical protein
MSCRNDSGVVILFRLVAAMAVLSAIGLPVFRVLPCQEPKVSLSWRGGNAFRSADLRDLYQRNAASGLVRTNSEAQGVYATASLFLERPRFSCVREGNDVHSLRESHSQTQ